MRAQGRKKITEKPVDAAMTPQRRRWFWQGIMGLHSPEIFRQAVDYRAV